MAFVQALLGDLRQALGPGGDGADVEHAAGVAVVAVLDHGDIDVDGVTVLERLLVGDAVAHHMVDRGADRLGETFVVERRRDRLLDVDDVVMAQAVELFGGDTGLDVCFDHFQHFGGQAAGNAHLLDVFCSLDGNGHEQALYGTGCGANKRERPHSTRGRCRTGSKPQVSSFKPQAASCKKKRGVCGLLFLAACGLRLEAALTGSVRSYSVV